MRKGGAATALRNGTPPYSVEEYMQLGVQNNWLDARRFDLLELADNEWAATVRINGNNVISRQHAWRNRWVHSSDTPKQFPLHNPIDIPWARTEAEYEYVRRMRSVVDGILGGRLGLESVFDVRHMMPYRFDAVPMLANPLNWCRDMSLETRQRMGISNSGRRVCLFMGWHNVELFGISVPRRPEAYWPVPTDVWTGYESSRTLTVPTPWIAIYFSYARDVAAQQDEVVDLGGGKVRRTACQMTRAIQFFAMAEFAWLSIARFIYAAQYGVEDHEMADARLNDNQGVLAWLGGKTIELIEHWGLVETLTTGGVEDIERSVMAYRRMEEVSWSRVNQQAPDTTGAYLYYDWDNGEVLPVPRSGSRPSIPVLYRNEYVTNINPKPAFSWDDVRREIDAYYKDWEEGEPVDEGVIDADEAAGVHAPADDEYDDINDAMVSGFYGDIGSDRLVGEVNTVMTEFDEDVIDAVQDVPGRVRLLLQQGRGQADRVAALEERVRELEGDLKAAAEARKLTEEQLTSLRRRFEFVDGARERALNAVAGVRGIMREYDAATHAATQVSVGGPIGGEGVPWAVPLVGGPSSVPEVVAEPVVNVVVEKPAE